MVEVGLYLVSFVLLLVVFWQDWRARAVQVWLFPGLLGCFGLLSLQQLPLREISYHLGANLLFLVVQLSALYLYFCLRQRAIVPVIGSMLGWGDVLFWVICCAFFSLPNFILFFLGSLLLSLFAHFLFRPLYPLSARQAGSTIPLAGLQALCLSGLIAFRLAWPGLRFLDDTWLLSLV